MESIFKKLTGKTEGQYYGLKQRLECVINLGLGTHCASEYLSELTESENGLVCLGAMLNHDVSGQALFLHHLELLSTDLHRNAMEAITRLSKKNTIFIC